MLQNNHKPQPRARRRLSAGQRVSSSDSTVYITKEDGSLCRETPKVQGKKARKRERRERREARLSLCRFVDRAATPAVTPTA